MADIYEQFFYLKYSGGWSFSEAYNLPIGLREWFVKRLAKQLQMEKEAVEGTGNTSAGSQTLSAFNQPSPPPGNDFTNKG